MRPPKNFDYPERLLPLRINLAKERIGWRKYKPLLSTIRLIVGTGIFFVICIPLLPIFGVLHLIEKYLGYKHQQSVENGVLTSELSVSPRTTVYLNGNDVSGILGTTDIEYSKSGKNASFNYRSGNGRYRVYGTSEEGLFMLVPAHSKINPEKLGKAVYYRCEVVRVDGGYNHGDFGEKSPMGSSDCIVLVCKKASKIPPSTNLIVIRRN